MNNKNSEAKGRMTLRLIISAFILLLLFFGLLLRLYNLQLKTDAGYDEQSERNRTRILSINAMRGNIYDSEMNVLATNTPVFTVSLLAVPSSERKLVSERLAFYLNDEGVSAESIYDTLSANARQYEAVLIKRLPYDAKGVSTIAVLEEHKQEIPGLIIATESMRYYPYGNLFGHSLGYVGKISNTELADNSAGDYLNSDWVGKAGLEKNYEFIGEGDSRIGLRGTKGVSRVVVNATNYPIEISTVQEPVQGDSLVLTMDLAVQNVMEQALQSVIAELQKEYPECRAGAAVLLDIDNAGVIAQASYPYLNPNDFADGLSAINYQYYMENKERPLINRAVSGLYAPGSTFKMVTALAALYSEAVTPFDTVKCVASAWKEPRAKCTKEHGEVNLYQALAYSCNTYFQEMGSRAGMEAIGKIGDELGLGTATGIDLPAEASGILPTAEYKKSIFKPSDWEYQWHAYDTFYTSMGQGYNTYTVIQLANYVATIANGGKHMQPYLVDSIIDTNTKEVLYQHKPVLLNSLSVDADELKIVQSGMTDVTASGGTAYSLFKDFPFKVAAKTGTAQTVVEDSDNGVFVAYAPADDPKVAFACVIEFGQTGGGSGGKICREVFRQYFGLYDDRE